MSAYGTSQFAMDGLPRCSDCNLDDSKLAVMLETLVTWQSLCLTAPFLGRIQFFDNENGSIQKLCAKLK